MNRCLLIFVLGLSTCLIFLCSKTNFLELIEKIELSVKADKNEFGTTNSGKPCRIVTKYDDGQDIRAVSSAIQKFMKRQKYHEDISSQDGIKYDCFMDLDTEEYSLKRYAKKNYTQFEKTTTNEYFRFEARHYSSKCSVVQYERVCMVDTYGEYLSCGFINGECLVSSSEAIMSVGILSVLVCATLAVLITMGIAEYRKIEE